MGFYKFLVAGCNHLNHAICNKSPNQRTQGNIKKMMGRKESLFNELDLI